MTTANHESAPRDVVGDPRFFVKSAPLSLGVIAQKAGGLDFTGDPQRLFSGVAPLQTAQSDEIAFLDNRKYLDLLDDTRAGAVIVSKAFADRVPKNCIALIAPQPYLAWARVSAGFYPEASAHSFIHPTAFVHQSAQLGADVFVGPHAVIEADAEIGDGVYIGAQAYIGRGVKIGERCRIGTQAGVSHALLGRDVVVHSGAKIGEAGFGFALGDRGFETVPQVGRVLLEDFVQVGCNTTIDRGSMRDTIIGAGTRIDNLVQIGHNVQTGKCCVVVAQSGISGSTVLGDFVTVAAQAGLVGHIKIGDRARIGAQCGVMSDVEPKQDVIGSPALPFKEFFKTVAMLRKMVRGGK